IGIVVGLIIGWAIVGLLRLILLLARKFRMKAPKAAPYTGKVFYRLCCVIAIISLGHGAWLAFDLASIGISPFASDVVALAYKYVLYSAGLAVFYWSLGWGVRYILSSNGASLPTIEPIEDGKFSTSGVRLLQLLRYLLMFLSLLAAGLLVHNFAT